MAPSQSAAGGPFSFLYGIWVAMIGEIETYGLLCRELLNGVNRLTGTRPRVTPDNWFDVSPGLTLHDGDAIGIYARLIDGDVELSDRGEMLAHLIRRGANAGDLEALPFAGIRVVDGALRTDTGDSNALQAYHRLIAAIFFLDGSFR
jgi:hypothetical protein